MPLVLIVEADSARTALYRTNAEREGCGIMVATTAKDGLKTLGIAPAIDSVCIAGVHHPRAVGFARLQELKREEEGPAK
jgi:hypothetical protein